MDKHIINTYTFEEKPSNDFIELMKKFYSDKKHIDTYIETIKRIKKKKNPSFKFIEILNFIAYRSNEVIGHISAMVDKRLGDSIGLIGFYECIEDENLSRELIESATNNLKNRGCKLIRAPIDLTIWHPYRFVVNQKDSFILEPITKDYYIKQFENQGFKIESEFGSGERTNYETILPYTKPSYDLLLKEGFKIEKVTRENLEKASLLMLEIAKKTFTDSWSYVEISKEEYLFLYQDTIDMLHNLLLEIVYNPEGKAIGFCSSIYDPINKRNMILKSIAILPEYQNKKIGAALIYSQHKEAKEKGILKIIYALVRMGNVVTKLPYPGITIFRKYVGLEKEIN
jgi:GNAT superfamily N-acetyltransferase